MVVADIIPTEMAGYAVDQTGKYDSTDGIQKALWDCFYAGGGTVYLPAGTYLITDTIYVPSYVTLCGDYQDPDAITEGDELEYGTIVLAQVDSTDSDSTGTFILRGSSGVVGLTVYYPEQTLNKVLPYPYTFYVPIGTDGNRVMTIKDVTVINGYRGIGTQYDKNHECLLVDNFKGTFLKTGLALHNQSDVGRFNDVTVSSQYWAEAAASCMRTEKEASIKAYTKENTVGILASCLEWTTFSKISIDSCKTAVHLVDGKRTSGDQLQTELTAISMFDVDASNCGQGILADSMDSRWGSVIARSSLGEIDNNTAATIKMTDVEADIKRVDLGTLFAYIDFEKKYTTGSTSKGTATVTNNGQTETFDYQTITRDYSEDAVVIKNEVNTTIDLSKYEWDDLAIEFWIKCSNASVTSFASGSYFSIGAGTAPEESTLLSEYEEPYLLFAVKDDIILTAGEWTKVTLNLCDATRKGDLSTGNSSIWAWFRANVVDDYSLLGTSDSISISDINIVEANIVESASADLSSYDVKYDATHTKPKEQLFVAELQKEITTDVSAELQAVLDQAGEAGGGIVYVPGGTYRLDQPIKVPTGVELRGASAVANREQRTYTAGTVFLCYYGVGASYNADTDDALITLNGKNAGISGIRIIYPENGSYKDVLNTTYTIRGKAAGVYVVNCFIMASAYGVDFRNCDNHFIKGVYTCCWYNTFLLGGKDGVVRDCLHNGNMITRTNAEGLPNDWPIESVDITNISDHLGETSDYIILEGAENEVVFGVSACSTRALLINNNSVNTLAVNVCSDKMGRENGIQFSQSGESSSMTVINTMRCRGESYKYNGGKMQLFNRIFVDDVSEENVTIN